MSTLNLKLETTNKLYANFLSTCGVNDFESVSDEKIEILKKKADDIRRFIKPENNNRYYREILLYIRKDLREFDRKEKALLLILIIDPNCIMWKQYMNTDIPNESEAKEKYNQAVSQKDKREAKIEYERILKEKENALDNLAETIRNEFGVYLPSLIPLEKLYLRRTKDFVLKRFTNINSLFLLDIFLEKIDLIKEIDGERKEQVDTILKRYQETFPKIDINLLVYHVFKQPQMLGIKSLSEQLYFLINAAQFGYEEDETLATIYQYYCTWDAMNEELKRVYGYESMPLLKLQGHYNTLYNIKGDF